MDDVLHQFLAAAAYDYQRRTAEAYGFDLATCFHLPEMTDRTEILFLHADSLIFQAGFVPEDFEFAS